MSARINLSLTIILVVALLCSQLPIAAQTRAFLNVFISDPADNSRLARVDADGRLQVAGNFGVLGNPSVQFVPTRPINVTREGTVGGDGDGQLDLFDVEAGQRLIIEFVSLRLGRDAGAVASCELHYDNDQPSGHYIPVVVQGEHLLMAAEQTRIYANGQVRVRIRCTSGSQTGLTQIKGGISGYLVDASE